MQMQQFVAAARELATELQLKGVARVVTQSNLQHCGRLRPSAGLAVGCSQSSSAHGLAFSARKRVARKAAVPPAPLTRAPLMPSSYAPSPDISSERRKLPQQ